MKELVALLNKEVANLGVLYTKLHNFHWYVEGPKFYQLHELYEKLYDEVTEQFDVIAERVLQLGEKPIATLKDFLTHASIKEASGKETCGEMFAAVLADYQLLDKEFTQGIELAGKVGDEVTIDMFVGMKAVIQKHVWMLKATSKN